MYTSYSWERWDGTLDHYFVYSKRLAYIWMEWDGISLFSLADTLELFVKRAEKSSQAAETYGEKKTNIQK